MISVGCVLGMHIRSGSGKGVLQVLSFYFFHNENLLSKFHEKFSINTFYKVLEYDFCWMCIACAYVVEVQGVLQKLSFSFFHNENLLSKFHEKFSINTFYKLLEYDFCWMCLDMRIRSGSGKGVLQILFVYFFHNENLL